MFPQRRKERWIEELNIQLQYNGPITSGGGATLPLPAAVTDLKDWINDPRKFHSMQFRDWTQVMDDFKASVDFTMSGPKLARRVEPTVTAVLSLLPDLIRERDPDPVVSPITSSMRKWLPRKLSDQIARALDSLLEKLVPPKPEAMTPRRLYTMDEGTRAAIRLHLDSLTAELTTNDAIVAAWRDLVRSSQNLKRTIEEVAFRRDTLYTIAQSRRLDVDGSFGVFSEVRRVITDVPHAVDEALNIEAGIDEPVPWSPHVRAPSGVPAWRRIELCDQLLTREPECGDCIVWLRIAPANLPQLEVTHGQVTLYNASYLSGFIGHPELADRFAVPPVEVLTPRDPENAPISTDDAEPEWQNDPNMVYARVDLPSMQIHAAVLEATALVKGLIAVNHASKDSWNVLKGTKLFVNGERWSPFAWDDDFDVPEMYYAAHDRMGRDIQVMAVNNRLLTPQSIRDLQDAITMSTALKAAAAEENTPELVMAAVRAIEHVNAWVTGGEATWSEFAATHFKKSFSQVRLIDFLDRITQIAINSRADAKESRIALSAIEQQMKKFIWPHERYDRRVAAKHVPEMHRIFAEHWLARGLGELEAALSSPETLYARLEEEGRRFDRQLGRLRRLRNSAIHAGPVSDTTYKSVANFAFQLGHQCLNQAMNALLTGHDVETHIAEHRVSEQVRYDRIRRSGNINDLFLPGDTEPNHGTAEP